MTFEISSSNFTEDVGLSLQLCLGNSTLLNKTLSNIREQFKEMTSFFCVFASSSAVLVLSYFKFEYAFIYQHIEKKIKIIITKMVGFNSDTLSLT